MNVIQAPYGRATNNLASFHLHQIANPNQVQPMGGGYGMGGGGGYAMGGGGGVHLARSLREVVTPQQLMGRAASSVGAMGEVPLPLTVQRDLYPPFPRQGLACNARHVINMHFEPS